MASDSTVKIKFLGDAKDLEKAIDGLDKDLLKVEKSAAKTGQGLDNFGKFAKKAAIGVGAVGVGAVALGVSMFELGNKLDIMKKKAATVFEDSLPSVTEWATKSASLMGLTKNEAVGLAAGFADLLKPMGFTAAQAADMSTDVVGLSGALAAWSGNTRTASEVSNILGKAMLGERESLKELGISILDADVKQRLLKNGTSELTGAALEQAKALATQELIMEKSTDAQKAWNERQFTGQEVSNNLKVKLKELREEVAGKLYPILLDVGTWLLEVGVPKIEEIGTKVGVWWEKQDGLREAIKTGAEKLREFTEDLITLIGWIKDAVEWTDKLQKKLTSLPGGKVSGMDILGKVPGGDKGLIDLLTGRASGGPVTAGRPYIVGEKRPEVFVPSTSGTILSSVPRMGGGSQVINLQMDGRTFWTWLIDDSRDAGGIPLTLKDPS